jgi:hypothetical protein
VDSGLEAQGGAGRRPIGRAGAEVPVGREVPRLTREPAVGSDLDDHQVGLAAALLRLQEGQPLPVAGHGGRRLVARVRRQTPRLAAIARHGPDVARQLFVELVVFALVAGEENRAGVRRPGDVARRERKRGDRPGLAPFGRHDENLALLLNRVVRQQRQRAVALVTD